MTSIGITGCFRLESVDDLPRNTQPGSRWRLRHRVHLVERPDRTVVLWDAFPLYAVRHAAEYDFAVSIEDSSEVPQVWRLRSEGSWTSHNGSSINFLGEGTIFGGDGTDP